MPSSPSCNASSRARTACATRSINLTRANAGALAFAVESVLPDPVKVPCESNLTSELGQKFACDARAEHVRKTTDSCQTCCAAAHFQMRPGARVAGLADLTALYEFTP